jgi:hypothetical protein
MESHTAFVTDKSTGKTKTSTKEKPMKGGLQEKSSSLLKPSDNACFICEKIGHYCRDCPERKSTNQALIVHDGDSGGGYSDADSEGDNSKHLAFLNNETALFSRHLLHLDSQSSTNVISNKRILVSGTIRKAVKAIGLDGVDKDTPGIAIDLVGDMKDVGEVYYSPKAAANILSFTAMTDAGAEISYDEKNGRFTMRPKGSDNICSFCRQDKLGCEGKFYVCDTRTMIAKKPTSHPQIDHAMVVTVSENIHKYSKREVESAGGARNLLARMGYSSVDNAIDMIRGSHNMKVTERDFRGAHDIWGKEKGDSDCRHYSQNSCRPEATGFVCRHNVR